MNLRIRTPFSHSCTIKTNHLAFPSISAIPLMARGRSAAANAKFHCWLGIMALSSDCLCKTLFRCMAVYIMTPVRGAAVGKRKADGRSGPQSSQLPNFTVEISRIRATSRLEAWRMSAHRLNVKKRLTFGKTDGIGRRSAAT